MTRRRSPAAAENVIKLPQAAEPNGRLSEQHAAISEACGVCLTMDTATLRTWIAIGRVLTAPKIAAGTHPAAASLHLFPPGQHPAFQPPRGGR